MNKKIISFFIACIMILGCIPTGMLHAQEDEKTENPLVLDLKKQAGKKYDLEDKIEVIVEIDGDTMTDKYGLEVPSMEKLKDDGGLEAQIDYAKESQALLLKKMDEIGIKHEVTMTYKTLLNGFATEILYKDALKLAELDEVLSLKISEENQILVPQDASRTRTRMRMLNTTSPNNEMVKANDAWVKYSGKGQLVAIIDSGADQDHPDFKSLTHGKYVINDESSLQKLIKEKGISSGKFYSNKIPFGFNYYDRNTKIKQGSRYSHGQHVAGIVGANGDKMTGVAPDAQLAILRVFGDSSLGTTASIYNKAIDDAVLMGADAINMSLGSTGTSDSRVEVSTRKAFENAKKAGIVISAAAGNDGFMGWGAIKNPKATTPDYGLINSPSVLDISMSVASINNTQIRKQGLIVNDGTNKNIQYSIGNGEPTDKDVNIVHVNYGYEEDIPESVKGKYALIQRGFKEGGTDDFTFEQKVKNVQNKGAIGAIIYNNSAENFSMSFKNKPNIPAVLISKDDGEYLVKALEKEANLSIRFKKQFEIFNNLDGYKMSAFSSWGVSPEGNLKPDITAPGGDIYSTVNTDGNLEPYDVMSGTSMAAPHVAGGIAIVRQYAMEELKIPKGEELHKVVKNLLMSTATPILDEANKGSLRVSPRNQGAGLMNLKEAIRSKVTLEGTNGVSSITLKNIEDNKLIIQGKLHNYGDETEKFTYKTELNTDTVSNGMALLKPKNVLTTDTNSIEVGPKQVADFKIEIDVPKEKMEELSKEMPKGFFLEGFVLFQNENKDKADLSIPFVGFADKKWESLDIIEEPIYDLSLKKEKPYYFDLMKEYGHLIKDKNVFTHIESTARGNKVVLGQMEGSTLDNPKYDKSKIAFSPNNDGYADEAQFVATFLRNYNGFSLSISDQQGEVYKLIDNEPGMKNFYKANPMDTNTLTRQNGKHWIWDGKTNDGNNVKDGDYKMKIHVDADGNLGSQDIEIPIKIDTIYPRIGKSEFDKNNMTFTINSIIEEGSGVKSVKLVNRNNDLEEEVPFEKNNEAYIVKVPNVNLDKVFIEIEDYAYNRESLPIHKAVRSGNEYVLYVNGVVGKGLGVLNSKDFKWHLEDSNLKTVDPYNLVPGKYTIVIDYFDEQVYTLEGSKRIPVVIAEKEHSKVQSIPFNYRDRETVDIQVFNNDQAKVEIVLLNKITGEEYEFRPLNNIYRVTVPHGDYKLVVKNVQDGYLAEVTGKQDFQVGKNLSIFQDTVIKISKEQKIPVTVSLNRNGYSKNVLVEFVPNAIAGKNVQVEFSSNENEKQVELVPQSTYQIYVKNIEDSYGYQDEEGFTPSKIEDSITIDLKSGQANKIQKVNFEFLQYKINSAENLNPINYKSGWDELQEVLKESKLMLENKKASQEEVNNQIQKIQTAIEKLVTKIADKAQLEEKIREAESFKASLNEGEFDPRDMEYLNIVIDSAKTILISNKPEETSPQAIEAQINQLEQAISNIRQKTGDLKEQLQALIEEGKKYLNNKADLKANDSLDNLENIIPKAEKLLLLEGTSKEDKTTIMRTINTLKNAIKGLEFTTDKSELVKLIEESESINLNEYTNQNLDEFKAALKEAKTVEKNEKAISSEIKTATDRLYNAKLNLKKKSDIIDMDKDYQNIPVSAYHIQTGKKSSADESLNHIAKIKKVSDNLYEYVIQFKEEGAVIKNLKFSDENNVKHDVSPETIEGEYNKQYRFTLPKKEKVRIGFNMYIQMLDKNMDVETDLLFDWSNFKETVEPVKPIQPIEEETNKDEKIYNVNPKLMKLGENVESQANNMINHESQVVLKNGMYNYAISFGELNSILEKVRVKIEGEWIDLNFKDNKFIFTSKDKFEGQRVPIKFVYEAPGIGRHEKEADLILENWVLSTNKENNNPTKPSPKPTPTPTPTPTPQPIPVPGNGREIINKDKPIIYVQPGGVEYNSPYYGKPSITAGNLQTYNNKTENTSKNGMNNTQKIDNSNFNKIEDVSGHWAESVIKYVMDKGYFKGTSQTTFSPEQEITGVQFITVLGRKSNISDSADNNQYFKAHLDWANKLGLLEGLEEGFDPNSDLNREEMAVILNNYLVSIGTIESSKEKIKYADKDEISYWAEDAIANLSANGILKGMENGKFSPKTSFTRAQIAQVLYNLDIK